ncbi:glycosyltransferase [Aestuariivivens marinum]|uniref:glycosyltransferase n=1 Tax=Aestuariivivens marinum TaxID=2913555 RepID=UPI001F5A3809|nr:glycosyltransferase [Aestuariivivens marinum]
MSHPLVSVLIPFKNTESFLPECIESIINQTYKHWEVLIVDDGSIDNSFKVVEQYAKKDERIKLLRNNGEGIIQALQLAFKYAKGTFITRMDSDDIMPNNKLEVLTKLLMEYGQKHVAVGQVKYFSKNGVGPGYKSYEKWLNNLVQTGSNYTEIYKECVIPSPCWMVYKSDLIACDAFNPDIYPEDYDLTFRFYKHGYKCIPCNQILHYWRDYSTRTSRTHIHYAYNHFTTLKTKHFIDIDYNVNKTLVVWGAGNKGKIAAKIFLKRGIPFEWICNNPNKIGKSIYGKPMQPFDKLKQIKNSQSIITVANKKAQKEIRQYFNELGLKPVKDYVFFC